jgi:CubicO group peptidase (beta-lactamase class C family)
LLDAVVSARLEFTPGARFAYSNSGYAVLGEILTAATGRPAHDIIRSLTLTPVGLPDTFLAVAEPGTATADPEGGRDPTAPDYPGHAARAWTAGAMVSTARDLAGFFAALAADELVVPSTLALMTSESFPGSEYGLGLEVVEIAGSPAWGHTGGIAGYRSAAFHFPDTGVTVAVITNTVERDADPLDLIAALAAAVASDGAPPDLDDAGTS